MSEGKWFHIHPPATGKPQRPTVESLTAGTDIIGGRGPKSLMRRDVSGARELPKVQRSKGLWLAIC